MAKYISKPGWVVIGHVKENAEITISERHSKKIFAEIVIRTVYKKCRICMQGRRNT
jgi:hypothetical protein